MSLSSKHPAYSARVQQWALMRDTYEGEEAVKEKGSTYLPPTTGMEEDGMSTGGDGLLDYNAYRDRAVVPDLTRPAVEAMVGLIHKYPPNIDLPASMEDLRTRATLDGETLESLLRRINTEQLNAGRIGLLLEVPDAQGPDALPYFVTYNTESVINWTTTTGPDGKDQTAMVNLDESGTAMNSDLEWIEFTQYRVLTLQSFWDSLNGTSANDVQAPTTEKGEGVGDGMPGVGRDDDRSGGNLDTQSTTDNPVRGPDVYQTATSDGETIGSLDTFVQPSTAGNTFEEIPFRFIGTKDLVADPDLPPLLGIARKVISIYRTEADYRETIHQQGQQTLVVIGESTTPGPEGGASKRVGAGRYISVPLQGDAKYVGVSAECLAGFRACIDADMEQASNLGANMLVQKGADAESGDALKIRKAAKTATLGTIAKTSCEALEQLLKLAAKLRGANPDDVKVSPNMDYTDELLTGKDVLDWMNARAMGAPISLKTIHQNLVLAGKTRMTFEEEMDESDAEGPTVAPNTNPRGAVDPNAPPVDGTVDPNAPPAKPGAKAPVVKTKKPAPTGATITIKAK